MKIGVVGGAGLRTPLLVGGLTRSDLPITEVVLYDVDAARLALVAPLAQRMAARGHVGTTARVEECVEGADFVVTSIRPGGIETRARQEAAAMALGVLGQETVGPVGFAMALAAIPAMVAYAREVERRAPRAWMVNFTNPVGIVTQAVTSQTAARMVGICDTPTELFEETAHVLGLPSAECRFDYFGLNHLGWLREVHHRGVPQLERLWDDPEALARVYRAPLFTAERLRALRLLPSEYVFYYEQPDRSLENFRRAGASRGRVIAELNTRLLDSLARAPADPVWTYLEYLAARDAGYMQIESGAAGPRRPAAGPELTGYDKIGLAVVHAIHFNTGAVIPLDVPNRGTMPDLQEGDVVEVPCVVNANGALPLHAGKAPESVRPLLVRVKEYERLTVEAVRMGAPEAARRALATNPLVGNEALAGRLLEAMGVQ